MKFKGIKKLTATLIAAIMTLACLAVPTTAYDYQDYLKDAAGVEGDFTYIERAYELGEVVTYCFPDYWETTDPYEAFWDAVDIMTDADDEFFVKFKESIYTFQLENRGGKKELPVDETLSNSKNIAAQAKLSSKLTKMEPAKVKYEALEPLINGSEAYFNTLTAAIMSLTDQYSRYISGLDYYAGQNDEHVGIGVSIQDLGTSMLVMTAFPGGGAEEAGIIPGDAIIAVDGKAFDTRNRSTAPSTAGEPGTTVDITVLHIDSTIETFTVTRKTFNAGEVTAKRLSKDTISISFKSFELMSDAYAFEKYYDYATANPDVTKLVIDIRDNTGGDSEVLNAICSVLTPEGTELYSFVSRNGTETITSKGKYKGAGVKFDGTLFVLTNENTASCGDITTGVIKNIGGIQVGSPTYGTGIGQSGYILHNGYMAWVTALIVDMPNLGRYHEKPIEPDVLIESTVPAFTAETYLPLDDVSTDLTVDSDPNRIKAYQQRLMIAGPDMIEATGVLDERTIWLTNAILVLAGLEPTVSLETGIPAVVIEVISATAEEIGMENVKVKIKSDKDLALEYCLNYVPKSDSTAEDITDTDTDKAA
jgi:carboxyl-terminal processing protease